MLDGEEATPDAVLNGLRDHPWVHFSCHGSLRIDKPFDSSFILHHGRKLTIQRIMQANLPNAELAFLAACHSATSGNSSTPDEALTLAAAMQFGGFRAIIGTLWSMHDVDGPPLAENFYKHMTRNGLDNVDVRDSATALHEAVKQMQEDGVPLERWSTFVHIGI